MAMRTAWRRLSCGTLAFGLVALAQCTFEYKQLALPACEPDCKGRQCGPDPNCGESCGTCAQPNKECSSKGECVDPGCAANSCDDENPCTYADRCAAGTCAGTAFTCTSDSSTCGVKRACDGAGGCDESYPGGSVSCDDGNGCTHSDACDGAGQCAGGGRLAEDPTETPDPSGLFVSADYGAPTGSGTEASPFDTITAAVEKAQANGLSRIYVAEGVYAEHIDIIDTPTGLFIDGGWHYSGLTFVRDCAVDARELTIISSPDALGVRATNVTHPSGLSNLTVKTEAGGGQAAADTPGTSRIGVLVRGDGSSFRLANVHVVAGAGQNGGAASAGSPGAGAIACASPTDCDDTCDPLTTGASGAPGTDAGAGAFGFDGYVPGDGAVGVAAGTPGCNGTVPPAAESRGNCNRCPCDVDHCRTEWNGSDYDGIVTAPPGTCGCGGQPGTAASGGRGGGASVGLLIVGLGANVAVDSSRIEANSGGDGCAGGSGGIGADGASGGAVSVRCHRSDCAPGGCGTCGTYNLPDPYYDFASTPGGPGGKGGSGGNGGAGAGGPSYAVVTVGGALVSPTNATLVVGSGGASGGGAAPSGESAETKSFP